mgnify:CR=1 FL=1
MIIVDKIKIILINILRNIVPINIMKIMRLAVNIVNRETIKIKRPELLIDIEKIFMKEKANGLFSKLLT